MHWAAGRTNEFERAADDLERVVRALPPKRLRDGAALLRYVGRRAAAAEIDVRAELEN